MKQISQIKITRARNLTGCGRLFSLDVGDILTIVNHPFQDLGQMTLTAGEASILIANNYAVAIMDDHEESKR